MPAQKYRLFFYPLLLISIHETGHLIAVKAQELKVGWPVFIPFMGAVIALKEAPRNAWIEAVVGIGGPVFGAIGALLCLVLYPITGNALFLALAYAEFWLNLFNLIPIVPLDGGRIVTAISPWLWVDRYRADDSRAVALVDELLPALHPDQVGAARVRVVPKSVVRGEPLL